MRAGFAPECPQRQNSHVAAGASGPPTARGKWGCGGPDLGAQRGGRANRGESAEEKELQGHPGQCGVTLGLAPTSSGSAHLSFYPRTSELFKSSHALAHRGLFADGKTESRGGTHDFPKVTRSVCGRVPLNTGTHSLCLLF